MSRYIGKKEDCSYIKRKVENADFKLYLNHKRNNKKKKTKDIWAMQNLTTTKNETHLSCEVRKPSSQG